jgi:glycosyltransferase involved in cell wall biosynthesis
VRIGLNLLYLIPGVNGGTETYARNLVDELEKLGGPHQYVVFLNKESILWPLPKRQFERVDCEVVATSRWQRYLYEQTVLPKLLRAHRIDLLHSLGYVSPLSPGCLSIVTIHDLNYQAFGSQMPFFKRNILRYFVSRSARSCDAVITISKFSAQQILESIGLPSSRVRVIYSGPGLARNATMDKNAFNNRMSHVFPYFLAFASLSPNKNLSRLITAFELAIESCQIKYNLVIIGHAPVRLRQISRPWLHFLGYLNDAFAKSIMDNATGFLFPSVYEGFGLPVLEAMAAGLPVACSTAAALPEVAGEGALMMDPYSIMDMKNKIALLMRDESLRQNLARKGAENLARFSWRTCAIQTHALYEEIISKKGTTP